MQLTIDSQKLGRSVTFSRPGSSYIYVNLNGKPGTSGNQLCSHGSIIGNSITYFGSNEQEFHRICWDWWRAYLASLRW